MSCNAEKKKRVNWTFAEESVMLNIFKEKNIHAKLDGRELRSDDCYNEVSDEMAIKGYFRSAMQVRVKYYALRSSFKNLKRKHDVSGAGSETIPHEIILYELFGHRPAARLVDAGVDSGRNPATTNIMHDDEPVEEDLGWGTVRLGKVATIYGPDNNNPNDLMPFFDLPKEPERQLLFQQEPAARPQLVRQPSIAQDKPIGLHLVARQAAGDQFLLARGEAVPQPALARQAPECQRPIAEQEAAAPVVQVEAADPPALARQAPECQRPIAEQEVAAPVVQVEAADPPALARQAPQRQRPVARQQPVRQVPARQEPVHQPANPNADPIRQDYREADIAAENGGVAGLEAPGPGQQRALHGVRRGAGRLQDRTKGKGSYGKALTNFHEQWSRSQRELQQQIIERQEAFIRSELEASRQCEAQQQMLHEQKTTELIQSSNAALTSAIDKLLGAFTTAREQPQVYQPIVYPASFPQPVHQFPYVPSPNPSSISNNSGTYPGSPNLSPHTVTSPSPSHDSYYWQSSNFSPSPPLQAYPTSSNIIARSTQSLNLTSSKASTPDDFSTKNFDSLHDV